ncbi:MAG: DNA repair protein RecN [Bacteroidota bacterium]
MLRRLHIERFALIEQLDLEVQPGFTVVTGETGAGKSIFLGALQLALGGRAEFASVGQPGFKCVVEAEFSVSEARKEEWASDDWDWWSSDGTASLVLRREIHPGGRSRAFINDSPVRLDELKRVSSALVDIHSQRDEGLWARSEGIVLLLENFAPREAERARQRYREAWTDFVAREQELRTIEAELGSVQDPEYLQFVVQELQALNLKPGEETRLRQRLATLSHVTELHETCVEVLEALDRDEHGVSALASQIRRAGERVARRTSSHEDLVAQGLALEELTRELRQQWSALLEQLDADPAELAEAEERLAQLDRLQRKHQCADEAALLEHLEVLTRRLELWEHGQERLNQAQRACSQARETLVAAGAAWNDILLHGASDLAASVREGLAKLAMPQTQIAVRPQEKHEPGPQGTYPYRLEFSANPGQPMQDLSKVASGGERSRLMLVLKRYLALRQGLSTVLFDEIDTGVSGGTAAKMASVLRAMSTDAQVLAITHLPQVAAKGSQHWVVEKLNDGSATRTQLRVLDEAERPEEVARLLSDGSLSSVALAQAKALMASAD